MPTAPPERMDPRAILRALLSELRPHDRYEAAHRADALAWVDAGAPIHRTEKPATPPKHLVSYCLLVDPDTRKALLVDHRDAGRWLPTGGHVDPGEHPVDTATREMHEELGIRPPFHPATGPAPLLVTVTETAGRSTSHTDVSLWFIFTGSEADPIRPDPQEFAAVRWWPFAAIVPSASAAFDPHLPRALAKLDRLTGDRASADRS